MAVVSSSDWDAPPTDAIAAASGRSLLGALVIVARHRGVQLAVPQLIR